MRRLLVLICVMGAFVAPASAQQGDAAYRISVLEEQVRQLNGKVEELTFQLLELQEQLRRTQEDNDYRLRELEDKQGNAGGNTTGNLASSAGEPRLEKPQPSEQPTEVTRSDGNTTTTFAAPEKPKRTIDGVELYDGEPGIADNLSGTLGTIRFDANGNIIDTELGKPTDLGNSQVATATGPLPQGAEALFQYGFNSIQSGHYEDAERALVTFSDDYPDHPRMPEAKFWLGESHLGRKQFQKAAKVYLDAHKRWPDSKYGPQSLLKLGVSVAGLNQRELACATFAEVLVKYPGASNAVKQSVASEQRAARCSVN